MDADRVKHHTPTRPPSKAARGPSTFKSQNCALIAFCIESAIKRSFCAGSNRDGIACPMARFQRRIVLPSALPNSLPSGAVTISSTGL
jgi:hypothetical protein